MNKQVRYIIRVAGKVQGVFFRKSTAQKAQELGLNGYVENRDDGTVYMEAEGAKEPLDKLLEWAHHGPDRARVESVVHEETSPAGYSGFEVKG